MPPSPGADPLKPEASHSTGLDPAVRDAIMAAVLTLQSYRWRLSQAGFPFREPPGVERTITRLREIVDGETDNLRPNQRVISQHDNNSETPPQ